MQIYGVNKYIYMNDSRPDENYNFNKYKFLQNIHVPFVHVYAMYFKCAPS